MTQWESRLKIHTWTPKSPQYYILLIASSKVSDNFGRHPFLEAVPLVLGLAFPDIVRAKKNHPDPLNFTK